MRKLLCLLAVCFTSFLLKAQNPHYWQQFANYKMNVSVNVENFTYSGNTEITYYNNSPDTLKNVYFHLYNNAFQPGSEMDIRLQSISDPDKRMVKTFKVANKEVTESRISALKPNEIGFMNITDCKQNGISTNFKTVGTILEVALPTPILPKSETTFTLAYNAQVPLQIRRSGRQSSENVALSMTQWYPKLCEYDFEGWHADPYIAREFHGVWANYDVKITIDKNYTLGATGYLQNKNEIGHGYEDDGVVVKHPKKTKTLTWHFYAPMVHDFAWGADNNFIHDKVIGENNVELHFLYKNDKDIIDNWKKLQPKTQELLSFFNKNIGAYPYKQYSIIQGGDGGMEYAMCTLITGKRSYGSLVGVTAHEMAHMWFQHILATNESKHEWMDEGFTTYISDLAMNEVLPPKEPSDVFEDSYRGYIYLANSTKEQPLTTHADRYDLNMAYGISAYSKGAVFLAQLGYIIGEENLKKAIKRFYNDFKFTHPTPNDFKRTAEKVSGAILDWYLVDFAQTTNTIDYGIKEVNIENNNTTIQLVRKGRMPMPIELLVTYADNSKELLYIPITLMRWQKDFTFNQIKTTTLKSWDWAPTNYTITLENKSVLKLEIDPSNRMADVNRDDNVYSAK